MEREKVIILENKWSRIDSINQMETKLKKELSDINSKIQNQEEVSPDFYEITQSWIHFGELVNAKCCYYQEVGYPYDLENKRTATSYDIVRIDEGLKSCHQKMREMEQFSGFYEHPLLEDSDIRSLYQEEIVYDSTTGYMNYSDEYKELLCQCMSVPFSIYQETVKDPNYRYDNQEEFLKMTEAYEKLEFAEDDNRTIFIGSILNKIHESSIWYQKEDGPLYPVERKERVVTEGIKY